MSQSSPSKGRVGVGDAAPDFTLPDQHGQQVSLGEAVRRGPVVLYFYPKDETPGCTAEACAFRDAYEVFREAGAEVIGVSSDGVGSHERFSSRHQLPFTLLADEDGGVRKRYGVRPTLGVLPGRVTYVIDGGGVVRHVFSSQMGATRHVQEALDALKEIGARG
jgi:thioredoxin-dependent peroxiredoxin